MIDAPQARRAALPLPIDQGNNVEKRFEHSHLVARNPK
jgi:hypothetical protein